MELEEKLALIGRWREVALQDLDAMIEMCTDDVVLDYSNSIGPMKGVYRGRAGLDTYGREMQESFSKTGVEVANVTDAGPDAVVLQTRLTVTGKGSGATASGTGGFLIRFRGEKIELMKVFQSYEEALSEAESDTP